MPARSAHALALRLVLIAVVVAACSAATGPTAPVGSPSASASLPSAPVASPGTGRVSTAEQAFAAVAARSPWFDGAKPKDPQSIGQAVTWAATPGPGGTWTVTVDVGWGDCPAGCIDHHVWTFAVGADGTVSLASETGPAVPQEQRAALLAAATESGIGGQVTAGPTCPVERPNDPKCAPRPVAGAVLAVKGADGTEVARFTTDGSGLYRIPLPPGAYTVEPQPVTGLMGTPAPQPVNVAPGKLAGLDIAYDTGIR
jgi:hypothetical protein